jgi:plasmid replication initiation protein
MKAEPIIMEETTIVKKSNALARAKRSADSIWIGRMVAIVASQVRKDDADFLEYEIPVPVILDTVNMPRGGKQYSDLIANIKKAMRMLVEIEDEREWRGYHLFDTCRYEKGSGVVQIKIHPDLKPHYLDLQRNFTRYPVAEYLALPSVYSQTLYEFLRSHDDQAECTISVAKLHEILCTPPSLQNFKDLRRRVLEKAHKDIHQRTKLKYEWEPLTASGQPVARGRKVEKIRFVFNHKKQDQAKAKARKTDQKKQSAKNNTLFLSAVQCAQAHKDQGGCGKLRGTQECCKACMESKKTVETELDLFDQKKE